MSYNSIVFLLLFLLPGCQGNNNYNDKKNISLRETYAQTDKNPFGGYVARQQVEYMYPSNTVREKKQSFIKTWEDIYSYDSASLYLCITPTLYVNQEEVTAMLAYVEAGNDLFIASASFDELLMKKIGCKYNYGLYGILQQLNRMQQTSTMNIISDSASYSYYYYPFANSFSNLNLNDTRVLGLNAEKNPNFIVHFYGKGKIFLHCDPRAFSNYFLLKDDNYKYMQAAMAFTSDQPNHLYWDDYYNKLRSRRRVSGGKSSSSSKSSEDFSTFSEINKHPSLVFAFWLSFVLLIMYLLFGGKRRQRIIEQQKANENTTVTFTETVGRLYLQKRDNKNIAEKMITYFNEYVRNHYFLNGNIANDDFITTLSRKSGVPKDRVETLYRTINHALQSTVVDDFQLLSLNEQIQNFIKQ